MKTYNILILEDEQRAGEKLIDSIKSIEKYVKIEWKRSIADAIGFLSDEPRLDIIFSDIELLDGNAFKVYEVVQPKCPIIFCTAYNTFYLDAFKTNGIAYLLKPYTQESFVNAWNKFLLLFKNEKEVLSLDMIAQLKYLIEVEKKQYKTTFSVKKRDGIYLLKTDNICYFEAQGDFVLAIDINEKKHIINDSLSRIENKLPTNEFFRINRSEIIRRESVLKYEQYIKNRLAITLSNSKNTLYTSNSRTPEFRKWIEN